MSEASHPIAITGATGFIGRHLTQFLVGRGAAVRSIIRPDSPRSAPAGSTPVRAPLDIDALVPAFAGASVVVHLAGVVESARTSAYGDVNVTGTRAVAEAARRVGARLIHISSLAAAGPASASAPRVEGAPPTPITPYGRSKLEGERVVMATDGLEWTILRPGAVYGPGDRAMLPLFQLVRGPLLPVVGRQDASFIFVHVRDVVAAIDAAITQHRPHETFFVGHPRPIAAHEIVDVLARVVGRRPMRIPVPTPLAWLAATACELIGQATGQSLPLNRSRYAEMCAEGFVCRVDQLRERLGVSAAIDFEEGVADTFAWYVREGWIPAPR